MTLPRRVGDMPGWAVDKLCRASPGVCEEKRGYAVVDTPSAASYQQPAQSMYDTAQRTLVALLLWDARGADETFKIITSDDVSDPKLRLVTEEIAGLVREGETVSPVAVAARLERRGELSHAGGIDELYALRTEGSDVSLDTTAELVATQVREGSAKVNTRGLLTASAPMFTDDSGTSAVDGISALQAKLSKLLSDFAGQDVPLEVAEGRDDYFGRLEERRDASGEDGLQGVPCLLPTVNTLTSGWCPGQLITVAAKTGVGKTVFAVDAAIGAGVAGQSAMFFSLEMSKVELLDRIVSCLSTVPIYDLQHGRLSDESRGKAQEAYDRLEKMSILIDTSPRQTVDSIRAKAQQRMQSSAGLDLVIVDYLQLIEASGRVENRQLTVDSMMRNLKLAAKSLGVPIMVTAQLNRSRDGDDPDRLPTLDDIRESGAIAMHSDIVLLLHRDTKGTMGETTSPTLVIVAKNRAGRAGKIVRCYTDLACSTFREMSGEDDTLPDGGDVDGDDAGDSADDGLFAPVLDDAVADGLDDPTAMKAPEWDVTDDE